MTKQRVLRILGAVLGAGLFALALYVLRQQLGGARLAEVLGQVAALPAARLLVAGAMTIAGYLALGAGDLLALRHLGRKLSLGKVLLTSFVGYAFANNLPFSFVVGGWVRYRLYSGWRGVKQDAATIVLFNLRGYVLGLATCAAVAFILEPGAIPGLLKVPLASTLSLGFLALAIVVLYLSWAAAGRTLRIRRWKLAPPPLGLALLQLVISLGDWIFSGAALYVLLPGSMELGFFGFFGVFILGQIAALIAQVPGGIGVFEAVTVAMLKTRIGVTSLLGILLAYRAIYFLLPLVLATLLLGASEIVRLARAHKRA
jgi:uncharacterized membrane protein YbhN (UPF0104 family)